MPRQASNIWAWGSNPVDSLSCKDRSRKSSRACVVAWQFANRGSRSSCWGPAIGARRFLSATRTCVWWALLEIEKWKKNFTVLSWPERWRLLTVCDWQASGAVQMTSLTSILTLSFIYLDFGPGFDFFERLQTFAIARFVLVLRVVEVLDALLGIVIVTSPAPQVAVVVGRWRRRWRWRRRVWLLVGGSAAEERIAVFGFGRATELCADAGNVCQNWSQCFQNN